MSEHWKSTPKYWCKNCSTYVKDTPFERKQHEATGRHQSNLKRFLNGIQANHAKNERDKERTKAEIERLNRIAGSSVSSASTAGASLSATAPKSTKSPSVILSNSDKKRQWSQLAEMGVNVPDQARADVAASGDWQVVSRKPMSEPPEIVDDKLNIGVRKRKFEGQDEEEEAGETVVKRGWGSTTKVYPGSTSTSDDLDSLLIRSIFRKKGAVKEQVQDEDEHADQNISGNLKKTDTVDAVNADIPQSRENESRESEVAVVPPVKLEVSSQEAESIPTRPETNVLEPIFKKRKARNNPNFGVT